MSDAVYLRHILERIERLEGLAAEGREAFDASFTLQDAAIRNFEVIGEAVKQLSPGIHARYPAIPWSKVAGLRDVLIHNYFGVDLVEVWNTLERDLPVLRQAAQEMLAANENP